MTTTFRRSNGHLSKAEDVAAARENAPRGVFLPYELRELREIGFFELRGEEFLPVGGYLYIHVTSG